MELVSSRIVTLFLAAAALSVLVSNGIVQADERVAACRIDIPGIGEGLVEVVKQELPELDFRQWLESIDKNDPVPNHAFVVSMHLDHIGRKFLGCVYGFRNPAWWEGPTASFDVAYSAKRSKVYVAQCECLRDKGTMELRIFELPLGNEKTPNEMTFELQKRETWPRETGPIIVSKRSLPKSRLGDSQRSQFEFAAYLSIKMIATNNGLRLIACPSDLSDPLILEYSVASGEWVEVN